MATVGFLHVASAHVREARRLLAECAPGVTDVHLVDRLLLEPGRDIGVRVASRVGELIGRDVDTVICTWPALTDHVVRVARERGIAAAGVEELLSPSSGVLALSR